jgi:YVTN family beta-propeller protein
MEFGVLGPVEARLDGEPLPLGGAKPRSLLAMLLLHANEVVSRDRLIDGLWGERPPASAEHGLDDYVSRLRRAIGADRLERRPPGYVLRVQPEELDLDRFEHLARQGRDALATDPVRASRLLGDALACWRGPALADVADEPFAAAEARRLDDRRLSVLEDRVEAELTTGAGATLVDELERVVREHPYRERPVAQLMLALYRSGRLANALELYRATRRRLADELGLEPGPQLRELERRILNNDPALQAEPAAVPPRPEGARTAGRRGLVAVAVAATVVAAGVAGLWVGLDRPSASAAPTLESTAAGNAVVAIDLRSRRVVRVGALPAAPAAIASVNGTVWVAQPDAGLVSRLDPAAATVSDPVHVGVGIGGVAAGEGAVWASSTVGGTIRRIDPRTGTVTDTIRLGVAQAALAFARRRLWVVDPLEDSVIGVDPATHAPVQTVTLPGRPSSVATGARMLWVASHDGGVVYEVDPRTSRVVTSVTVGQGPAAIAFGGGAVWVANSLDGTVTRIDPGTARPVSFAVGNGPSALVYAGGYLWVADEFSRDVAVVDPADDRVVKKVPVGGRPVTIARIGSRLWVGTVPAGDVHRGGTLTLLGFRPISIDPAFNQVYYPTPQFDGLAYDTLLTFDQAGGSAGLHLVPDLALALPTLSGDGTTLSFRLRRGIHYSDGRLLRASDFRRGIERLYHLRSPGTSNLGAIAGAHACSARPDECDLSRGIETDDRDGTVTFHLTAPDPDLPGALSLGFFVPVPPGTPDHGFARHPFPGTGPYEISGSSAAETRFVRNPRFREWSNAAQPAGYPDAIVWRYLESPTAQVRMIEGGRADWMFEQIAPNLLARLEIERRAEIHNSPALGLEFVQLDTRLAPFDKLGVRRALDYAIDRNAIVRLFGGASDATPTCQVIPPDIAGYRRYCPYTLHPSRSGRWTAPDLGLARRLVAASHTRGETVTLWVSIGDPPDRLRVLAYVAGVLHRLGYHAQVRDVKPTQVMRAIRQGRVQAVANEWYGGNTGAGDFLQGFLGCDGAESLGWYCSPSLDRLMNRASALAATNTDLSDADWAEADRRAVDAAGLLPLVTPHEVEFVSTRLRNYQYNPINGFLADQAWLH